MDSACLQDRGPTIKLKAVGSSDGVIPCQLLRLETSVLPGATARNRLFSTTPLVLLLFDPHAPKYQLNQVTIRRRDCSTVPLVSALARLLACLCRKTCSKPVDEDLRATLKAFCTGLVAALNKYYAFGSVFAEEV